MTNITRLISIPVLILLSAFLALAAYDVYPYFRAYYQLEKDFEDGYLTFPDDGGIANAKFNACRAWHFKLYDEATRIDRRSDWIAPEFEAERKAERACLLKVAPDASGPTEAWVWSFHIRHWLIHFPDKALEAAALKGIANARSALERHREIYDRQTELSEMANRSFLIRNIRAINNIVFWTDQLGDEYNALNTPIRLLRDAEYAVREPVVSLELLAWKNHMLAPASSTKSDTATAVSTH